MFEKLSLRMRITFMTTMILVLISVILTLGSMYNASFRFVTPLNKVSNDLVYSMDSIQSVGIASSEAIYVEEIDNSISSTIALAESSFKADAVIYMIIIIFIGSAFIYFILGRMFIPVKKLSSQVELINEHQLSKRITDFKSGDELNELADSFNTMLDRLDKAFESQKRFSSDAAHELKTPLTVLKTNLDVLAMDENPETDDYKHAVSVFKKQTERMINLVNNLFILSAQKEYEFNDVIELDKIVKDSVHELEKDIENKNLIVNVDKCNLKVKGNKTMVTHAISNLIHNAVKYNNSNGSIFATFEKDEEQCIIRIKDTGMGIPEENVDYIFEPFYRVDLSRSRKVGGAGLGLAITSDIINRHGGAIKYMPNINGGSVFEITLPLLNEDDVMSLV